MAEQKRTLNIVVGPDEEESRIDVWLSHKLKNEPSFTRSAIQKLIQSHNVLINNTLCKNRSLIQPGDNITLSGLEMISPLTLQPAYLDIDIIYEDEHIIVINKSQGVSVHPGAGRRETTLVEGLIFYLGREKNYQELFPDEDLRPGVVHRLDKDTSGVLVYAKTCEIQKQLMEQFKKKMNKRRYLALLNGCMEQKEMSVESLLFRDPVHRTRFKSITAQELEDKDIKFQEHTRFRVAKSHFRQLLSYQQKLTLAAVTLATGRTHQIRVHSQEQGFPVFADPIYGTHKELTRCFNSSIHNLQKDGAGQYLHAFQLTIKHPISHQDMTFEAPPPKRFCKLLDALEAFRDDQRKAMYRDSYKQDKEEWQKPWHTLIN